MSEIMLLIREEQLVEMCNQRSMSLQQAVDELLEQAPCVVVIFYPLTVTIYRQRQEPIMMAMDDWVDKEFDAYTGWNRREGPDE